MRPTFFQSPDEIRLVCYRLEIGFWRLAIDLLSDSKLLQKLVAGVGNLAWQCAPFMETLDRQRAVRWAAAGLGIGFFAAILSAVLNH